MIRLDRRHVLSLAAGTAGAALLPRSVRAAIGGTDVYTASPGGGLVDSTVILGEEAAIVVDAQFTAPDAAALADLIAATGRRLETIFITHAHPDHVLGLDVLLTRFPEARPVTHALLQPQIAQSTAATLEALRAGAPAGTFAARAIVPEVLDVDHLLLEGERIEILEPMHGDTDLISAVHIPALDTLIATDFAYQDTHTWVAENTTPERIALWRESLDRLEAIGAGTVIPGHRAPESVTDAGSAFAWTRDYLDLWEAALAETGSADALRGALMEGREDLGMAMAVDRAVAAMYPDG